ncbi:MAG: CPBP family intramembrane metalloprotease [Clostridiaceae bacterium]|nr:CPBP family intramembrane metalloprotease [Clostridiaceae bacterium]
MTIRTITTLREGCASFYRTVLKNPYVIGMAILFVTGKVAANRLLGASWGNALRSGIMGLVLYGLGCLVIHLLSSDPPSAPPPSPVAAWQQGIWLLVCYGLIVLAVTSEVLGWNLSPWHEILTTWQFWVARWQQMGLSGWPYLLFYIALPIVLFFKSGRLPRLLGWRQSRAALPFVLLYLVAYTVIRGVTLPGLLTLLFVLVWPALGEEFFFRGLMQPVLTGLIRNPVTAVVITAFLFTLVHVPSYLAAAPQSPLLAFSGLLPVLLTGFFWGYGFERTRVLWPWVLIHALSDLVGF